MICDTVGAPHPARLEVDCRLNASAGFRHGALSLVRGDLVLTVGLPLASSLSVRQFGGVLAHELGHFNQRLGLRASAMIRATLRWLHTAAYEPDPDETRPLQANGRRAMSAQVVASTARFGIGLSRALLRLLLAAGRAGSGFLLRQMELDADRCQIELAGSEAFEETFRRLHALRGIAPEFYRGLRRVWNSKRQLPESLPVSLCHAEAALSSERRGQLVSQQERAEAGTFASHPANNARLERARQLTAPGVLSLDVPAEWLFSNYEVLSRQVTLLHYEEVLRIPRETIELIPAGPSTLG
jgi:Zn-dependent protease with chaperone function